MTEQTKTQPTLAEIREGLVARKHELDEQLGIDQRSRGDLALRAAQGDAAAGKALGATDRRIADAQQESRAIDAAMTEVDVRLQTEVVTQKLAAAKAVEQAFPKRSEELAKAMAAFEKKAGELGPLWDAVMAAQSEVNGSVQEALIAAPRKPGDLTGTHGMLFRSDLAVDALIPWLERTDERPPINVLSQHLGDRIPQMQAFITQAVAKSAAHAEKCQQDLRYPESVVPEPTLGHVMQGWSDSLQNARRVLAA